MEKTKTELRREAAAALEDQLFGWSSAARYLDVSERWLQEKVRLRAIPFCKVGKFIKFRKSDLDAVIERVEPTATVTSYGTPVAATRARRVR